MIKFKISFLKKNKKREKDLGFWIAITVCLVVLATAGFIYQKTEKAPSELEVIKEPVHQSATDNLEGWAWSSNIGWIAFNCTTDPNTDCSIDSNFGVKVDLSTGDFSGYAWSDNVGWISFNRAYTGNPPSDDPGGGSGPIAKFDSVTGKVKGWMRVLANTADWDGWIKLGDDRTTGNWIGNDQVHANFDTDELEGWAWGDEVVGWVSFNCKGPNMCGE